MKCASEMERDLLFHWKSRNVYWKFESCKNIFSSSSLELLRIREVFYVRVDFAHLAEARNFY
jgi:hypothetical protein